MSDENGLGPNDFYASDSDGNTYVFLDTGGDYSVWVAEDGSWETFGTWDLPDSVSPETVAGYDGDLSIDVYLDSLGAEFTMVSVYVFGEQDASTDGSIGGGGDTPGIHQGETDSETPSDSENPPGEGPPGEGPPGEEPSDEPADDGEGSGVGDDRSDAVDRYEEALSDYEDSVAALEDAIADAESASEEISGLADDADDIGRDLDDIGEELDDIAGVFDELADPRSELDRLSLAAGVVELRSQVSALHEIGDPGSDVTVDDPAIRPQRAGDPVMVNSGAFVHLATDVRINGFAGPTVVERRYSNQTYHVGSFGGKWDSWIDANVRELSSGTVYVWTGACRGVMYPYLPADDTYETPSGEQATLERDGAGFRTTDRSGTTHHFDADGHLVERRDRFGNATTVERDANGRPTSITDPNGRVVQFTLTGGRIRTIVDWTGRTWTYTYSSTDDLVRVDHPDNTSTSYVYEQGNDPRTRHNLVEVVDERGVTIAANRYGTSYASFNRVVEQTVAGDVTSFDYDVIDEIDPVPDHRNAPARSTTVIDPLGTEHVNEFDPFGSLVEERVVVGTRTEVTTHAYDELGHHIQIGLPDGRGWRYRYDLDATDPLARHDLVELVEIGSDGSERTTNVTYGAYGAVGSFTGPGGATTIYELDALSRTTRVLAPVTTAADGSTSRPESTITYNGRGQIVTLTTPAGYLHRYSYRGSGAERGQLLRRTIDGSTIETYEHDELWRVTAVTDANDSRFSLAWDDRDRVVARVDSGPDGTELRRTDYSRNDAGHIISSRQLALHADGTPIGSGWVDTLTDVDDLGRPTRITNPLSPGVDASVTQTWNAVGRLASIVGPTGIEEQFSYDTLGRLVERVIAPGTNSESRESWTYDRSGEPVERVDPHGGTTLFEHDEFARLLAVTDPLGIRTEFGIDENAMIDNVQITDAAGVLRSHERFSFDEMSRMIRIERRVIAPDGAAGAWLTSQMFYDEQGRHVSDEIPTGGQIVYEFDHLDAIVSATDPLGNVAAYERDGVGNVVAIAETAVGEPTRTSHLERDALGRLVAVTNALDASETFDYDTRGLLESKMNADGAIELFDHDLGGRMIATTRQLVRTDGSTDDIVERRGYDAAGRLTSIVDANGGLTRLARDPLGRLASITLPDGSLHASFTHGLKGELLTRTDAAGTVTEFGYDAATRLAERRVDPAQGVLGASTDVYEWDALGRLIEARNDDHVVTIGVDSLGRVVDERQDGVLVASAFGNDGLPTTTDIAGLCTISTTWDAALRLVGVELDGTQPGFPGAPPASNTPIASLGYSGAVPVEISLGNDLDISMGYDAAGRLASVDATTNGTEIERQRFLRDPVGRVAASHRAKVGARATVHDSLGRIISSTASPSGQPAPQTAPFSDQGEIDAAVDAMHADVAADSVAATTHYEYDNAGNRTRVVVDGATTDFSSDAAHRLTSVGGVPVANDLAGNVSSDGVFSYAYDAANRLRRISRTADGSVELEMTYDALGRAVSVTTAGVATTWRYSGREVVAVFDDAGDAQRIIVPSPWVDRPFAEFSGAGDSFAIHDQVGTVVATADANGNVHSRSVRNEFGVRLAQLDDSYAPVAFDTLDGDRGLQSRETWSSADDLHHFRARVMRPEWGRFLQPDPRGPGLDPALYTFVANDPTRLVDPDGEIPVLLVTAGIGAIVGGALGAGLTAYQGGSWSDIAVAGLAGAAGGAIMGSGMGLVGFALGGATSGAIMGGWEGNKVGGWKGAAIGTTFGAGFGALGGVAGGAIGQRISTGITGMAVRSLAPRLGGVTAYIVGADVGVVAGGFFGGGAAGGIGSFGIGTGVGLAAGQDVGDALRTGAGAVPAGVVYGAVGGAVGSYSTKMVMNRYAFQTTNDGALGAEGEFFARNSLRQTPNEELATPFKTAEGKIPDFVEPMVEVKNKAEIPSLCTDNGQLRSFVGALGPGETLTLMHRPGVAAPPGGAVAQSPQIVLQEIPHWAFIPQVYQAHCDW